MNTYPQSVREDIVVQNLEDETLLYNLKTNKALCLNETSALIWEMCDGKTSSSAIAENLGERLKKPVAEELVWFAVDQLRKEDLLENADTVPIDFAGLSRREVIRKIGIGSMVALPIVSSIVAPNALSAQSNTCHMGVCIQAGDNVCPAGCNIAIPAIRHTSTDGTCTGTATPTLIDCSIGPSGAGNDIAFP